MVIREVMRPQPFAKRIVIFYLAALRLNFKYDVVLARVLYHLQPEIVFCSHFSDGRVIDLQRFDLLREIGCVSPDVDYLAHAQRGAGLELHDHN